MTESAPDQAEAYRFALQAALSDANTDMCLLVMGTPRTPIDAGAMLHGIREAYPNKPLALCIIGVQSIYDKLFPAVEELGIPVFPGLYRAIRGLAALNRYAAHHRRAP